MELQSMKMSQEEKSQYTSSMACEAPEYPYGLSLNIDQDAMETLGMAALPQVEQTMIITARVKVSSVSSFDSGDGPQKNISLQITDMAIGPDTKSMDPTSLYGSGN